MYQETITITRKMKSTRSDIYKNLLTRKDFDSKLSKLEKAQPSQRPTLIAELCDMFSALDIKHESGMDISYYDNLAASSDIPEFRDIEEKILEIMYNNFENYPTPEMYMLRIVDRLSDVNDGWQEDSLRLRILKRFIKYLNCGVYKISNGKKRSIYGWEKVILEYVKKHGAPKLTNISDAVKFIDEGIFEEYFKDIEKAQRVLNESQNSPALLKIREEINELKKDKTENKNDKNALKKIEIEMKKKQEALKTEQKNVESAKSKLKNIRKKYGLVKLADDFSKGIFRSGGATKQDLYLFAIAFDMTYTVNKNANVLETENISDYNSDIEKNLFEDYYSNNMTRFFTAAYEGDLSAFELDPSGIGINYKNFAEMIYIYYISQDLEPIEKLRRATDMIERLKHAVKPEQTDIASTQYYTALFTEKILSMSETDFENFIAENYDCNAEYEYKDAKGNKKTGNISVLQIGTAQETAFFHYRRLIEQMEKKATEDPSFLREYCNYGLSFFDVSSLEKYRAENLKKILKITDEDIKKKDVSEKFEKFVKLLYGINMFLGHLFVEDLGDLSEENEHIWSAVKERREPAKILIKKMSVEKPENMSRTALIVAFYYRYNQLHEKCISEKSFVDVMDDYTDPVSGLNGLLEASGYQPINDRNIFDLAVIFSSYAHLYV